MKDMTIDQLKERREAIVAELDNPEADLNALHDEMRAINAELEARKEAEAKKAEIRAAVAEGVGETIESIPEERKETMSNEEIRNSKEYINAYAEYLKTEDASECRALLSENVSGKVAVPDYVYEITKTAWEREGIMARVRKAFIKGNLKVGFEISGSDAVIHTEGGDAVAEEQLVLGTVELVPQSIKKWISISDEVMDLRGEAFLDYIYDELTYRIAKKAADELIAKIKACGTVSTTTCPGVPAIAEASIAMGTVAKAIANLSDEANEPVIMMNKLTYSNFKTVQYANGYGADPFEGLPVLFNDTIASFDAATTGVPYLIVGDLQQGALANFPAGQEIELKYDDRTLMTADLVRVLGREYVAMAVVAPKAFVKVVKAL